MSQPSIVGGVDSPAGASRIFEAARSCDSILCEGAPKVRSALASFNIKFLLVAMAVILQNTPPSAANFDIMATNLRRSSL